MQKPEKGDKVLTNFFQTQRQIIEKQSLGGTWEASMDKYFIGSFDK